MLGERPNPIFQRSSFINNFGKNVWPVKMKNLKHFLFHCINCILFNNINVLLLTSLISPSRWNGKTLITTVEEPQYITTKDITCNIRECVLFQLYMANPKTESLMHVWKLYGIKNKGTHFVVRSHKLITKANTSL
jgi:hypothetical protein